MRLRPERLARRLHMRAAMAGLGLLVALLLISSVAVPSAMAAGTAYVVTNSGDDATANPGVCTSQAGTTCTLRDALAAAVTAPGDTIDVRTSVTLTSPLTVLGTPDTSETNAIGVEINPGDTITFDGTTTIAASADESDPIGLAFNSSSPDPNQPQPILRDVTPDASTGDSTEPVFEVYGGATLRLGNVDVHAPDGGDPNNPNTPTAVETQDSFYGSNTGDSPTTAQLPTLQTGGTTFDTTGTPAPAIENLFGVLDFSGATLLDGGLTSEGGTVDTTTLTGTVGGGLTILQRFSADSADPGFAVAGGGCSFPDSPDTSGFTTVTDYSGSCLVGSSTPASTTTNLSDGTSDEYLAAGVPTTLNATVSDNNDGSAVSTGSVRFSDIGPSGGQDAVLATSGIGLDPNSGNYDATTSQSFTTVGQHILEALYEPADGPTKAPSADAVSSSRADDLQVIADPVISSSAAAGQNSDVCQGAPTSTTDSSYTVGSCSDVTVTATVTSDEPMLGGNPSFTITYTDSSGNVTDLTPSDVYLTNNNDTAHAAVGLAPTAASGTLRISFLDSSGVYGTTTVTKTVSATAPPTATLSAAVDASDPASDPNNVCNGATPPSNPDGNHLTAGDCTPVTITAAPPSGGPALTSADQIEFTYLNSDGSQNTTTENLGPDDTATFAAIPPSTGPQQFTYTFIANDGYYADSPTQTAPTGNQAGADAFYAYPFPVTLGISASPAGTTAEAPDTVTYTVTASPDGSPQNVASTDPQGTITLFQGTTQIDSITTDANGQGTDTVTLDPGSYPTDAVFSPSDDIYGQGSTGTLQLQVSQRPTTTAVTVSPANVHAVDDGSGTGTAVASSSVTADVTVTSDNSDGNTVVPGGKVTLSWNGETVATLTLGSDGKASTTLSSLPVGAGPLTASYAGTTDLESSSKTAELRVGLDPTTTSLTAPGAIHVGDPLTVTGTVANTDSTAPAPIGTVTITDGQGGTVLGSGAVAANGTYSIALNTANLTPTSHTLYATYGDPEQRHTGSSANQPLSVSLYATQTAETVPAEVYVGSAVTVTGTVSDTDTDPSTPAPAGTVTITDGQGGTVLGSGTVGSGGGYSVAIGSSLAAGAHTIVATFVASDGEHRGSSTSQPLMVNLYATQTAVAQPAAVTVGTAVTITGTVSDTDSGPSPAGTVTVTDGTGGGSAGSATVGANGNFSVSIGSSLPAGTYTIVATFTPSNALLAGSSGNTTLTVNSPHVYPTATAVSQPGGSVAVGSPASVTGTVSDTEGGGPVPTGTVNVTNGSTGAVLGSATIGTDGSFTVSFGSSLSAGRYTIVATFTPSDGRFGASSGSTTLNVINPNQCFAVTNAAVTAVTRANGTATTAPVQVTLTPTADACQASGAETTAGGSVKIVATPPAYEDVTGFQITTSGGNVSTVAASPVNPIASAPTPGGQAATATITVSSATVVQAITQTDSGPCVTVTPDVYWLGKASAAVNGIGTLSVTGLIGCAVQESTTTQSIGNGATVSVLAGTPITAGFSGVQLSKQVGTTSSSVAGQALTPTSATTVPVPVQLQCLPYPLEATSTGGSISETGIALSGSTTGLLAPYANGRCPAAWGSGVLPGATITYTALSDGFDASLGYPKGDPRGTWYLSSWKQSDGTDDSTAGTVVTTLQNSGLQPLATGSYGAQTPTAAAATPTPTTTPTHTTTTTTTKTPTPTKPPTPVRKLTRTRGARFVEADNPLIYTVAEPAATGAGSEPSHPLAVGAQWLHISCSQVNTTGIVGPEVSGGPAVNSPETASGATASLGQVNVTVNTASDCPVLGAGYFTPGTKVSITASYTGNAASVATQFQQPTYDATFADAAGAVNNAVNNSLYSGIANVVGSLHRQARPDLRAQLSGSLSLGTQTTKTPTATKKKPTKKKPTKKKTGFTPTKHTIKKLKRPHPTLVPKAAAVVSNPTTATASGRSATALARAAVTAQTRLATAKEHREMTAQKQLIHALAHGGGLRAAIKAFGVDYYAWDTAVARQLKADVSLEKAQMNAVQQRELAAGATGDTENTYLVYALAGAEIKASGDTAAIRPVAQIASLLARQLAQSTRAAGRRGGLAAKLVSGQKLLLTDIRATLSETHEESTADHRAAQAAAKTTTTAVRSQAVAAIAAVSAAPVSHPVRHITAGSERSGRFAVRTDSTSLTRPLYPDEHGVSSSQVRVPFQFDGIQATDSVGGINETETANTPTASFTIGDSNLNVTADWGASTCETPTLAYDASELAVAVSGGASQCAGAGTVTRLGTFAVNVSPAGPYFPVIIVTGTNPYGQAVTETASGLSATFTALYNPTVQVQACMPIEFGGDIDDTSSGVTEDLDPSWIDQFASGNECALPGLYLAGSQVTFKLPAELQAALDQDHSRPTNYADAGEYDDQAHAEWYVDNGDIGTGAPTVTLNTDQPQHSVGVDVEISCTREQVIAEGPPGDTATPVFNTAPNCPMNHGDDGTISGGTNLQTSNVLVGYFLPGTNVSVSEPAKGCTFPPTEEDPSSNLAYNGSGAYTGVVSGPDGDTDLTVCGGATTPPPPTPSIWDELGISSAGQDLITDLIGTVDTIVVEPAEHFYNALQTVFTTDPFTSLSNLEKFATSFGTLVTVLESPGVGYTLLQSDNTNVLSSPAAFGRFAAGVATKGVINAAEAALLPEDGPMWLAVDDLTYESLAGEMNSLGGPLSAIGTGLRYARTFTNGLNAISDCVSDAAEGQTPPVTGESPTTADEASLGSLGGYYGKPYIAQAKAYLFNSPPTLANPGAYKGILPFTPGSATFLDSFKDTAGATGLSTIEGALDFENAGVNWTSSDMEDCLADYTFG